MPFFRPQQFAGSLANTVVQGAAASANNSFTATPTVTELTAVNFVQAGSGTFASTGALAVPNNTVAVAARNQANSADISLISTNASNTVLVGGAGTTQIDLVTSAGSVLQVNNSAVYLYGGQSTHLGGWYSPFFSTSAVNGASTGLLRGANNTTLIASRNQANNGDISIKSTTANEFVGTNSTSYTQTILPAGGDANTTRLEGVNISTATTGWTTFDIDFANNTSINGINFSSSLSVVQVDFKIFATETDGDNYTGVSEYTGKWSGPGSSLTAIRTDLTDIVNTVTLGRAGEANIINLRLTAAGGGPGATTKFFVFYKITAVKP